MCFLRTARSYRKHHSGGRNGRHALVVVVAAPSLKLHHTLTRDSRPRRWTGRRTGRTFSWALRRAVLESGADFCMAAWSGSDSSRAYTCPPHCRNLLKVKRVCCPYLATGLPQHSSNAATAGPHLLGFSEDDLFGHGPAGLFDWRRCMLCEVALIAARLGCRVPEEAREGGVFASRRPTRSLCRPKWSAGCATFVLARCFDAAVGRGRNAHRRQGLRRLRIHGQRSEERLAGHNRGGVDDVHRRCLARRRQRLPSAMVAAVVHIAPAAEPGAAGVSAETRHERQGGRSVRTSCGKNRTRCWWPPRRPCPPGVPRTRVDSSAHARMVRLRERGNGNRNRNGQTCASLSAKCSLDTPSRWLSSSNRLASILNLAAISCKPAVRAAGGARQRERSR